MVKTDIESNSKADPSAPTCFFSLNEMVNSIRAIRGHIHHQQNITFSCVTIKMLLETEKSCFGRMSFPEVNV